MTDYVGFDLETTGISSFLDLPVSFGFVQHFRDASGSSTIIEGGFVNPGVTIPAGAKAVHGITDEMVADAAHLADAVDVITEKLGSVWASGGVIVGMNVSYDLTMVDSLCQRLGLPTLEERAPIGAVIDILVLDRHFDKWRKGPRTLTDLCGHYGVILADAHSAAADAGASLTVLETMIATFDEIERIPVPLMNATLRAWYQEWLTSFSAYLEKKGEAPIASGRYAWPIHLSA